VLNYVPRHEEVWGEWRYGSTHDKNEIKT